MVKPTRNVVRRERWILLIRMNQLLTIPMNGLAFIWLILTIKEIVQGLNPTLSKLVNAIWVVFWLHFGIELVMAPNKRIYIKHNWPTALSLILPALRLFRLFRFLKYASYIKGSYFIKIISSVNRGMRALSKSFGKRGIRYVIGLTVIVVCAGAAGILAFEKDHTNYFKNYGVALWWTAMMITTMGSDYFPKSPEGRFLTVLLATYGFAIFGYVTGTVATFFIDSDKHFYGQDDMKRLEKEVKELKTLILSKNQDPSDF